MSVPAVFRVELQVQDDRPPFLTSMSRCLALYPNAKWLEIEQRLTSLAQIGPEFQAFQRLLLTGAVECPIDRQGRVLVPPTLREHAGLEREVMIAGVGSRVEIWDRERFEGDLQRTIERADQIQSNLSDLDLRL